MIGTVNGATIYVPDDYPTIQGAIDAASWTDDVIIVRPGTYLENIDFTGKEVTVKSELGPAVTTIDGNNVGNTVTFASGESPYSILEGFTITHGFTTMWGGGIYCSYADPTIIGNIITGNEVDSQGGGWALGGGIYLYSSHGFITDNIITNNRVIDSNSSSAYGGGIYCDGGSAGWIEGNLISDNSAYVVGTGWALGAGIHLYGSGPGINGNTFSGNICETSGAGSAYGAAISCDGYSNPWVEGNTITGNKCVTNLGWDCGGGIYSYYSTPTITGNVITNNEAPYCGGGIELWFSDTTVANNIIAGNIADEGAGIVCYTSYPTIVNNTIAFNTGTWGGGISCQESNFTIDNTILWQNSAAYGNELYIGSTATPSTVTIDYSDLCGGAASCEVETGCTLNFGSNMMDANPAFVDPAGGDFHLTWTSPCKNMGNNSAPGLPTEDFEGDPRVALAAVDIGADEYYYHLYKIGDVIPGGSIDIRIVGGPGFPVMLALGDSVLDPPVTTPHGDLYLPLPLKASWNLGTAPGSGVLNFPATVPSYWQSGEEYPFQALVGPWGGPYTMITNLMVLKVQ